MSRPRLLARALSRTFVQTVQAATTGRGVRTERIERRPHAGIPPPQAAKRREYLRDYLRWLWPHRFAVAGVFGLALLSAGLEMIEPLFMRFIVDRVLLNTGLDLSSRLTQLHLTGAAFVGVVILSNLIRVLKDYRQRLLNVQVMLTLRRVAVRPPAASAAAEALGHEDGRHPLASQRRRRDDDRLAADGRRVAVGLAGPAAHRRDGADAAQLASGADGVGHHPGRDDDQLRLLAPHPPHLPHRPQGHRARRRPCRRNVLGYPRRPRLCPRDSRAARLHARAARRSCARNSSRTGASCSCGRHGACSRRPSTSSSCGTAVI